MNFEHQVSSAHQLHDYSITIKEIKVAAAEKEAIRRKGIAAQVESNRILADQREELEVMRTTINTLLKHSLEQAEQQAIASQERDKIEAEKYRENLRFTKIAVWTGLVGTVLAIVSIVFQIL